MFDQETWRREIAERLSGFARNPRQEVQLAAAPSLLSYLVLRTLEPFLEAFQREPIAAVLALADITRDPGADQIVRRAAQMRYQSAAQLDRELRSGKEIRAALEQLLIELQTVALVRQRLNGSRILATQYHDDGTAAPRQYEYRVTAVNSKGKESHWTAVVIQARTIVDPGTNKIPSPFTG